MLDSLGKKLLVNLVLTQTLLFYTVKLDKLSVWHNLLSVDVMICVGTENIHVLSWAE